MPGEGILPLGRKAEFAEATFGLNHRADALKLAEVSEAEPFEIRKGETFADGCQTLKGIAAPVAVRVRIGQGADPESVQHKENDASHHGRTIPNSQKRARVSDSVGDT